MSDEDLRREGAADAVLILVAAKTLLNPHVRADDVASAVGLTRRDLEAALGRLRAGRRLTRSTPKPRKPTRKWETFDRRWSQTDNLVYEAVGALQTAGPGQIQTWLSLTTGHEVPYSTIMDSLCKQANLGRLVRPSHGRYRRAA